MVKIGERELVFSTTAIVQDECNVTCTFPLNEIETTIILLLHPSPEGKQEPTGEKKVSEPTVRWEAIGENKLRIDLRGWTNMFGSATKTPLKIGQTSDGRAIGISLYNQRVGVTNRLDFQVFVGGSYE
jgi:hypothetical protein